jgi:putative membrane protein
MTRRPRAFSPEDPGVRIRIAPEPLEKALVPAIAALPRRAAPLGGILSAAILGLICLWSATTLEGFVRDLFARSSILGWTAAGLAGLAALAASGLLFRELRSIRRAAKIQDLRIRAERTLIDDDRIAGRAVMAELTDLYAARPETASGRSALAEARNDIIDGADLVRLCESRLMPDLDARAAAAIAASAKRVSVATAVAPRALLDILIVGFQSLRLVKEIALIYGARPGTAGFLRILRAVTSHLVLTGGIAVGDSLVQQVVGHGLAARISARLGEGVLNGLLTARVGLAALEVCRPLPFTAVARPGLMEVAGGLFVRSDENP